MISKQKNDLRLKVRLIKALTVNEQKKVLDLQEFFSTIKVSNNHLIKIKKCIIQLLKEFVKYKTIHNQLETIFKSGRKGQIPIKSVTVSNII
jgi:hypothetical protein